MRIVLTISLYALLSTFQPFVKGDNTPIEWLYTETKDTYTSDILQYVIPYDGAIEIYTHERITTKCKISKETDGLDTVQGSRPAPDKKCYDSDKKKYL